MMIDLDSKENYVKFLEYVKQLGMIKIRYHYLLVTLVSQDYSIFKSLKPRDLQSLNQKSNIRRQYMR
jgi:hypothetical protein